MFLKRRTHASGTDNSTGEYIQTIEGSLVLRGDTTIPHSINVTGDIVSFKGPYDLNVNGDISARRILVGNLSGRRISAKSILLEGSISSDLVVVQKGIRAFDIYAGSVAAGSSIHAWNITSNGRVSAKNFYIASVLRASDVEAKSSIAASKMVLTGNVNAPGILHVGTAMVDRKVSAGLISVFHLFAGDVQADDITADGNITSELNIISECDIYVKGDIKAKWNVRAERNIRALKIMAANIYARGHIKYGQSCDATNKIECMRISGTQEGAEHHAPKIIVGRKLIVQEMASAKRK